jgi:hypothetical protein
LAHHNDWSKWFAISNPLPIYRPSFNFMGGVAKIYIIELRCEKTFLQGHILSTLLEMFTKHHQIANPTLTCGCLNEFQTAYQL